MNRGSERPDKILNRLLRERGFKGRANHLYRAGAAGVISIHVWINKSRVGQNWYVEVGAWHGGVSPGARPEYPWHLSARLEELAEDFAGTRAALDEEAFMTLERREAALGRAVVWADEHSFRRWENEDEMLALGRIQSALGPTKEFAEYAWRRHGDPWAHDLTIPDTLMEALAEHGFNPRGGKMVREVGSNLQVVRITKQATPTYRVDCGVVPADAPEGDWVLPVSLVSLTPRELGLEAALSMANPVEPGERVRILREAVRLLAADPEKSWNPYEGGFLPDRVISVHFAKRSKGKR